MNTFFKLLRFILFTLFLSFTINSTAQSPCEQSLSFTQSKKLMESGIEGVKSIINLFNRRTVSGRLVKLGIGGVRGPRPENPLDTSDDYAYIQGFSGPQIKFREAYNRGFFTEDERYILRDDGFIPGRTQSVKKKGFIPARIKSFEKNSLVIEEVDIDGNITERIIMPSLDFEMLSVHPIAMNFFTSLDSRLAEVGPVQYPRFNKEAQMKKQGFKKETFQGLDTAYKMTYLANYLRRSKINPYKTHIADFSNQIPERIRLIQEGLKGYDEVTERLELLNELALEALKKQQEKGVTYSWWLMWNKKLASLLAVENFESHYRQSERDMNYLIQFFPDFVALPSLETLGMMAINKLISENIFPLGFVNKTVFTEGREFQPNHFFDHDVTHALGILTSHTKNSNFPYGEHSSMTAKELYEKIQSLPATQQQQAELIYFLNTHEVTSLYDNVSSVIDLIVRNNDTWLQFIPEHNRQSEEKSRSYIKEAESVYRNLLME